jgi:hypothetical protein
METKTIEEHLERLPEPYRSQALENLEKYPRTLGVGIVIIDPPIAQVIREAFIWAQTPQGFHYWEDLFIRLRQGKVELEPEPLSVTINIKMSSEFDMERLRELFPSGTVSSEELEKRFQEIRPYVVDMKLEGHGVQTLHSTITVKAPE